jgi:List-Bact-rpt repeat protein
VLVGIESVFLKRCAVSSKSKVSSFLSLSTVIVSLLATASLASAAKLTLNWTDTSNAEDGFRIERRVSTGGSYQQIAEVGTNVVAYVDLNLASATAYCYRVIAFNAGGSSGYSNEHCATTATDSFALTVSRVGTGDGVVTSSPAGIDCSSDCSENYTKGTVVALTAVPASGSVFAGWSGSSDCTDGKVTVNANISCTATFNVVPVYTLATGVINDISASGAASGWIVSDPAGIDCGPDCTESYPAGKAVKLIPVAAANSKFTGWSGDADCSDGALTMNANRTCMARFAINAVTLSIAKKGKGKVVSGSAGIDCGSACAQNFIAGMSVSLQATADPGFVFSGWSDGCAGSGDCAVTLSSNMRVTANFSPDINDKIGIYRPATGEWFLDRDGNNSWDGCGVDLCVQLFTGSAALPVVGDWNDSGSSKVGLFASDSSEWFLDANGNGIWDGCQIDICSQAFGADTDVPLVGQWSKGAEERIAIFRPRENKWHLDVNGNETLDTCKIDKCFGLSVHRSGDVPIAGDWNGRGTTQLGLFRPSTGQWFLDRNGNRKWNGCKKDRCISSFGMAGDIPVAGDWNGTGITKIGVYRPSGGEWFLDLNGNGVWDGPYIDFYIAGYGQAGDLPVIGHW